MAILSMEIDSTKEKAAFGIHHLEQRGIRHDKLVKAVKRNYKVI